MFFDLIIYIQIFLISIVLIIFLYKYILILLIVIELVVINISLIMFLFFCIYNIEFYLIYYLVFRVCERVLGLRLLVIIVRFWGDEFYYLFNIRKF